VQYTPILTGGDMLIAALNNTGSVNTTNSRLGNSSGEFSPTTEVGGIMLSMTHMQNPLLFSNYEEVKVYLEKAFIIVRSAKSGSLVVHSIKIEVAAD
jgi:hypothetical protein